MQLPHGPEAVCRPRQGKLGPDFLRTTAEVSADRSLLKNTAADRRLPHEHQSGRNRCVVIFVPASRPGRADGLCSPAVYRAAAECCRRWQRQDLRAGQALMGFANIHPANELLTHEIIAKATLGIDVTEQPRWG